MEEEKIHLTCAEIRNVFSWVHTAFVLLAVQVNGLFLVWRVVAGMNGLVDE